MTDNEHCTNIMERVQVGDQIEIRGHVFDVGVRSEGLQCLVVMSVEHDPLTHKTVSRLRMNSTPFELDVCNGPVYEIDPGDVRYVGADTNQNGDDPDD